MATKKQLQANKKNALASTGPRTSEGKAVVARNAVKHGLTGVSPVVFAVECEEDWQDFRKGVHAEFDAQGSFEETLVERVAMISWRLHRVSSYETGVINVNQEEVEGKFTELEEKLKEAIENRDLARRRVKSSKRTLAFLASLTTLAEDKKVDGTDAYSVFDTASMTMDGLPSPNRDFAKAVGLPAEAHENAWTWNGWTVGLVRQVLSALAAMKKITLEELLAICLQYQTELRQQQEEWGRKNQDLSEDLTRRRRETESRLRRRRMLPNEKALAKIARYEGHLGRQLHQALHELQRIQERRRGGNVPPPMVLDVNIDRPDHDRE
jgi:hypothetical protein